jgi:hypothetical protein
MAQDVVRYTLPAGYDVETAPTQQTAQLDQVAAYTLSSSRTPTSVTVRRDLIMGEIFFPLDQYPKVRTFYSDFEGKDHASVVLKGTSQSAAVSGGAGH